MRRVLSAAKRRIADLRDRDWSEAKGYARDVKLGRFVLSVATVLAGCDKSSALGPPPPPPAVSTVDGGADPATGVVRFLSLGDSLSQGVGAKAPETGSWPALLSEKWKAKGCSVELKNPGMTRFTAADILREQVPHIATFKPTLVTLQVGSNDVANGVAPDEFRKNVKAILDAAKKSGARVLVMPQNEWFRSPEGPSYGKNLAQKRGVFDRVLQEETNAAGAEWIDLRHLFREQAEKKRWSDDGIHPTAECYDAWADEMARVVPKPCPTK